MNIARRTLNIIFTICFLVTLLVILCSGGIAAQPISVAQEEISAEFPKNFFSYLDDKYTLYLGENRGACAYRIDPTDVYKQDTNRFVTAEVSQGWSGSACRDVIDFQVFQADCQASKFYGIERREIPPESGSSGSPRSRWQRFETSLTEWNSNGGGVISRNTTAQLAEKVCNLPVRATATESSPRG